VRRKRLTHENGKKRSQGAGRKSPKNEDAERFLEGSSGGKVCKRQQIERQHMDAGDCKRARASSLGSVRKETGS